jgi:DNA invertase Pin-like site-specific DNA recombinase
MTKPALAYFRTSSATNVGEDKDTLKRQREAVTNFAKANGFEIIETFYDPAVSGADPVDARPGFVAMLARIAGNGVKTVIVETANRFARDLMVQEAGYRRLRELGIELIASDSPIAFIDDTPTSRLIRQVLGAVAEFDRAVTVAKLRGARDRRRRETGRCEGRLGHAHWRPETVALARELRDGRTLRAIADELARRGHVASSGKPFSTSVTQRMLSVDPLSSQARVVVSAPAPGATG